MHMFTMYASQVCALLAHGGSTALRGGGASTALRTSLLQRVTPARILPERVDLTASHAKLLGAPRAVYTLLVFMVQ